MKYLIHLPIEIIFWKHNKYTKLFKKLFWKKVVPISRRIGLVLFPLSMRKQKLLEKRCKKCLNSLKHVIWHYFLNLNGLKIKIHLQWIIKKKLQVIWTLSVTLYAFSWSIRCGILLLIPEANSIKTIYHCDIGQFLLFPRYSCYYSETERR